MSATNLEEMARQAKAAHAASNLPVSQEANNEPPLEETSKFEIEQPKEEETSITNGEGIAAQMNQMVMNESEDKDEAEDADEEEGEAEEEPEVDMEDGDEDDDDDDAVMLIPDAPEDTSDSLLVNDIFELSNEEIKEQMPDIPEEEAEELCNNIRMKVTNYRKDLIAIRRMAPDTATTKAMGLMKDLAEEENIRYLKDHPNLLVVSVDKKNEKNVTFTDEEKEKMVKAKVIKLEVVETDDLLVQKVRNVPKRNKLAIVQTMDRYMSQYSVPLPEMNDFVTFKGAQLIEINNLRIDETTDLIEVTEKKANLVYKQLIGGANLQKYDDEGKVKLFYNDFLNIFPINDLDLAVYGVMVASSMEEMETELTCNECHKPYPVKYNLKTLMRTKGLSDEYKERFNEILKNKSNAAHLKKMYEKNNITHRVKSPVTKNIYEINAPSIARTLGLYQHLDFDNDIDTYLSIIYQYISKLWMYDSDHDDYVIVEEGEYAELFAAVRTLPQTELNLLGQYIDPLVYRPYFSLKTKCNHCGFKAENGLTMNDLIFLTTQGSPTEIRL